ncbi:ATP synthase F1 subunit epsilon [Velocimicrobium porci]|uniref:ATP synthase epsilon chain n=1 Tax=Velocimicrobium porci TaxID=2606634 RepID=A0A6L5XWH5_9FIRM|nr:ATP synthase F1 subunit epsilon [Velocimicrobium porci]MSS62877.1 ATP synthase F1 subunit epsilon [Velocimicrobium porci]
MAEKLFNVQVICPERQFFNGDAEMLELKTTEGEIGVLAGHIPLTAVISPGVMRIINGDEVKEAALHDGFVEILGDKVVILAESCEWPDEIDVHRAEEAKIRAERRLKSGDGEIDEMRAELALRKSLIRIDLAQKYSK